MSDWLLGSFLLNTELGGSHSNKLQKLEDELVKHIMTAAEQVERGDMDDRDDMDDRVDMGDKDDKGDRDEKDE